MKKRQGTDALQYLTAGILCIAVTVILLVGCYFIVNEPRLPSGNNKKDLPYEEDVYMASEKYDVEPARIYAVIQVESSFRETVISKAGAIGLMQMMPDTYAELCEKRGCRCDPEDLKDPSVNIDFCTDYLRYLYDCTGSWKLAHLAYNVGIGKVMRWLKDENYSSDGKTLHTIPNAMGKEYLDRIETAYDAYLQMME